MEYEQPDEQDQERIEQAQPKKSTGFVCAQLFNTVKRLAAELKPCECKVDEDNIVAHDPQCIHWQAAFIIESFKTDHMPEDAEIWMRTVTLVSAIQTGRRRGTAIGYTSVPEGPLNELARLAEGHPRAVTDAYAAMESLRGIVARMKERRAAPITDKTKTGKARSSGYRKAVDEILDDIEQVTDPMATDICSGLIQLFAAWTTTRSVPIVIGATEDFIRQHKLRRNSERDG